MKKEILILATVFSTLVFVSCSKEGVMPEGTTHLNDEIVTSSNASKNLPVINPLYLNLEGWFTFDNNLKDKTGKLADGISTSRGIIYTTDRKGNTKSALYLDGSYGVDISNVIQQTNTSLSVWVKYSALASHYLVTPNGSGPALDQMNNKYFGVVGIQAFGTDGVVSGILDNNWHHLVITFDGVYIRFYIDGALAGTKLFNSAIAQVFVKYRLGYRPEQAGFWKGSLDDLRFYSRTLSASDVASLYNQ